MVKGKSLGITGNKAFSARAPKSEYRTMRKMHQGSLRIQHKLRGVLTVPELSSIHTTNFANFIGCIRRKLQNKTHTHTRKWHGKMPKIHYQNNKTNYKTIEPHFCSKKYIISLLCIYLSSIHVSVWKMSGKSKVCITVLKLAICKYFLCTQRVGNVMEIYFIQRSIFILCI